MQCPDPLGERVNRGGGGVYVHAELGKKGKKTKKKKSKGKSHVPLKTGAKKPIGNKLQG